jgi:hypothetical protein
MKQKFRMILAFFSFLIFLPAAYAQFTAEEIAQRPYWEDFLKTAEIVRFEDVGEGVTKPVKIFLKKGDVEAKAAWKNAMGGEGYAEEGWDHEIAAYRLDNLLGLDMIPVTVEREFKGKRGALSLWATVEISLLKIEEQKIEIPVGVRRQIDDKKYVTRAFDCLIANEDRTQQNVLYTKDWRTILIDHSRAFRSSKGFTERLMFGKNGLKKHTDGSLILFRRLPRPFVEKVKTLSYGNIKEAVGPYLTAEEIDAILKRKLLLLAEVDEMIKESGEDKVLY